MLCKVYLVFHWGNEAFESPVDLIRNLATVFGVVVVVAIIIIIKTPIIVIIIVIIIMRTKF